jgi:hypothetical protein
MQCVQNQERRKRKGRKLKAECGSEKQNVEENIWTKER